MECFLLLSLDRALHRIAELKQHSSNLPTNDQPASTITAPSYAAVAASADSATTRASQRSINTCSPNDAGSSKRQPRHKKKILWKRLDDSLDPIHKLRCNLSNIGLQNSCILDIHYPDNRIVAFLVHNNYTIQVLEAFDNLQVQPITDLTLVLFLTSRKYRNSSDRTFLQEEADRIYQARLLAIVKWFHDVNCQIAAAHHFCFIEHWISEAQYSTIYSLLKPHKPHSTAAAKPDASMANAEAQHTAPSNNLDSSSRSTNIPADGTSAPTAQYTLSIVAVLAKSLILNLALYSFDLYVAFPWIICASKSPMPSAMCKTDLICNYKLPLVYGPPSWYCLIQSSNLLQSLDIDIEQCIITCTVTHTNASFSPITLVNIYAPATYAHQNASSPISSGTLFKPDNTNSMFTLGDFNYHVAVYINDSTTFTNENPLASSSNAQRSWAHFTNSRFFEFPCPFRNGGISSNSKFVAQRVSRKQSEWRVRQIKQLQRKRNKIRQSKDTRITSHLHPIVERQISHLQSDTAQNQALRASRHWPENGEQVCRLP
ncbi:hypothetical protein [Parasitella parasitica]|uniref:Uncharacterized protein n=1 Tax=Parasitella parasitica TaxID=35722 RepID=A0A0B7NCH0_9FUNG|nr:hypothetical protein [Parasitella parasitica]